MKYRIFTVVILICFQAFVVYAHGDEPRLEISPERMNPGGVVDVRGVDFEPEEVITLMLVNSQNAVPLGEIVADVEGVFLLTIILPVEQAEGTYNFLAITDDHNITSPDLAIQGPPVLDSEGGHGEGGREEEDPLLAPMPTFAPGVVPGGVVPPTVQPALTNESALSRNPTIMILFGLLVAVVLIILGIRVIRKR